MSTIGTAAPASNGRSRHRKYVTPKHPARQGRLWVGPAQLAQLKEPHRDQAVTETTGLVMTYDGKPIDALYTATCGGETSDVGTMFPSRNEPYLKRTRCVYPLYPANSSCNFKKLSLDFSCG